MESNFEKVTQERAVLVGLNADCFTAAQTATDETLEELEPAYAVTVHKSQGSEFKAVILMVSEGSDLLFTRNLLYTAMTRAKQLLILVGSPARLSYMVQNVSTDKRYSGLKFMLKGLN